MKTCKAIGCPFPALTGAAHCSDHQVADVGGGETTAAALAESGADVLAAVVRGIDPDAEAPTPEALAEWWPQLPESERLDSGNRLRKVSGASVRADVEGFDAGAAFALWDALWDRTAPADLDGVALAITRGWLAVKEAAPERCPGHPLAPIVRAWLERPRPVHPERRRAGRLPASLAQVADGYGRARDVLPRLRGTAQPGGIQYSLLPQLGGPVDEYAGEWLASALPVELYLTRGRGAPLDIRIGLEAILSVRPEDRRGRPVAIGPHPWQRWLARIYPGRRPGRASWPGLQRALEAMRTDSRWWLPVSNGMGGWEAVHVVSPIRVPLTGRRSERVTFAVTLDTAARRGGVTDRRLIREAGAKSTAALGLVSGLPLVWDRPGDLRAKEADRWLQNPDPRAYPLIALRGVVSLMYPGGPPKRKRWPQLFEEARQLLDWLAERGYATWTREPGGRRIMPGPDWPGWRPEQRPLIEPPK